MLFSVLRAVGTTLSPFVLGVVVLWALTFVGTPVLVAILISLGATIVAVFVLVQRHTPSAGPFLVIGIALLLVVAVWLGGGMLFWRGY
jgi:hypothetical protein